MRKLASIGFIVSLSLFALFHFIELTYSSAFITAALSCFGICSLLFTLILLPWRAMLPPLFMLTAALLIMITSAEVEPALFFSEGARQMRALLVMLLLIPMVGWVLKQENYIVALTGFFQKQLQTSKRFYFGILTTTQISAYFLLFGSIPVMFQLLQNIVGAKKEDDWESFKASALLRGFSLSTLWVISTPSLAYVVTIMKADIVLIVIQGTLIALLGVVLAVLLFHFDEKAYSLNITEELKQIFSDYKKDKQQTALVLEFCGLFLSLLAAIFLMNSLLPFDILTILPIVIFSWTLLYFLLKRKTVQLYKEFRQYFSPENGLPMRAREFSIFLAAGFLIYSLNGSGWGYVVVEGVYSITEQVAWLNLLWFLPFTVPLLAMGGLMPSTVMVLVGGILQHIPLPYPPELIVLALTTGSVFAVLLSPMIVPAIVLSGENGRSPLKNSLFSQWKFALLFYICTQAYIQAIVLF
ncbi:hypothetical protein [Halalkalibacter oceani]|uniref:hypothetical protein n=1 Tax=Halalkalibacter oceani TaxID=1653776 RepID=UPI003391E10E